MVKLIVLKRTIIFVGITVLMASCTSVESYLGLDSETETIDHCFVGENDKGSKEITSLNDSLDCVFGKIALNGKDKEGKFSQDEYDKLLGLRLLRAQAVVTGLAHYGALYAPLNPEYKAEDAAAILAQVEDASKRLWETSKNLSYSANFKEVRRISNTLAVSRVAKAAGKPYMRRAKTWIGRVVAAIAGQPADLISGIGEIDDIIKRALTVRVYRRAFIDDTTAILANIKDNKAGVVETADWQKFDELLTLACEDLKAQAGQQDHHCIPDRG